jgi:hypothetical protein
MIMSCINVDFWTILFFIDSCCFWTMLMSLLLLGYVVENDVQVLLKYGLIATVMLLKI